MANAQSGNSAFIDTSGMVSDKPDNLLSVILTATSANAILQLADTANSTTKLDVRVAASGTSQKFSFEDAPMFFVGGITVAQATNCVATLIRKPKGQ